MQEKYTWWLREEASRLKSLISSAQAEWDTGLEGYQARYREAGEPSHTHPEWWVQVGGTALADYIGRLEESLTDVERELARRGRCCCS
jgi:hypothetical protein